MSKRIVRRGVAGLVAGLLALVTVPVVAPAANAVDACGLGETCTGALSGSYGDSTFMIMMPQKFNGTVMLYSHGYRIPYPVPAAVGEALGMDKAPTYSKVTVPGVGDAYQGNGIPQVGPSAEVVGNLLAQGYALAGAGYANQGWATAEGVEAGESLLKHINAGAIPNVKNTVAWGDSLGAVITDALVERNPKKIDGSMPRCGALAGPEQALTTAMTVMFTWKTLIAPSLTVANYSPGTAGYVEAVTDLATVFGTLQTVATNPVSPAGYPTAQANLLAGLMAGLPTVSPTYDGQTLNPAVETLGLGPALVGGYTPVSPGQSSAVAMLQNVGAAATLGIFARLDIEQRVRAVGGLPADANANVTGNVNTNYSSLLSDEQRSEFESTFAAAGPGTLDGMLTALDASQGNASLRYPANPVAEAVVSAFPIGKPNYDVPTVLITNTYDTITPAGNQSGFYQGIRDSKKGKKAIKSGMFKAVAYYTIPPAGGWTRFEDGAKAPSAALSAAALGGSGVGHCAFTTDQSLGAVSALGALMKAKTPKQVASAKRIGYRVAGVNKDRFFEPPALK